jgi:hypothetical protein
MILCDGAFIITSRTKLVGSVRLLPIKALNSPTEVELAEFKALIGKRRTLPTNFVRDVIMKAPSHNILQSPDALLKQSH